MRLPAQECLKHAEGAQLFVPVRNRGENRKSLQCNNAFAQSSWDERRFCATLLGIYIAEGLLVSHCMDVAYMARKIALRHTIWMKRK
jgi:hypothetical protein